MSVKIRKRQIKARYFRIDEKVIEETFNWLGSKNRFMRVHMRTHAFDQLAYYRWLRRWEKRYKDVDVLMEDLRMLSQLAIQGCCRVP